MNEWMPRNWCPSSTRIPMPPFFINLFPFFFLFFVYSLVASPDVKARAKWERERMGIKHPKQKDECQYTELWRDSIDRERERENHIKWWPVTSHFFIVKLFNDAERLMRNVEVSSSYAFWLQSQEICILESLLEFQLNLGNVINWL